MTKNEQQNSFIIKNVYKDKLPNDLVSYMIRIAISRDILKYIYSFYADITNDNINLIREAIYNYTSFIREDNETLDSLLENINSEYISFNLSAHYSISRLHLINDIKHIGIIEITRRDTRGYTIVDNMVILKLIKDTIDFVMILNKILPIEYKILDTIIYNINKDLKYYTKTIDPMLKTKYDDFLNTTNLIHILNYNNTGNKNDILNIINKFNNNIVPFEIEIPITEMDITKEQLNIDMAERILTQYRQSINDDIIFFDKLESGADEIVELDNGIRYMIFIKYDGNNDIFFGFEGSKLFSSFIVTKTALNINLISEDFNSCALDEKLMNALKIENIYTYKEKSSYDDIEFKEVTNPKIKPIVERIFDTIFNNKDDRTSKLALIIKDINIVVDTDVSIVSFSYHDIPYIIKMHYIDNYGEEIKRYYINGYNSVNYDGFIYMGNEISNIKYC